MSHGHGTLFPLKFKLVKKPEIHIEVVSDVVCPWCYIGKRRMEKAIDQLKDQCDFTLTFSPFELNLDVPPEGLNQKAYLIKKFGGEARYDQITQQVAQVAQGEGLHFDFKKQKISPNTRDCHRIIWMAKAEGKQMAVNEAFMKAYFEEGVDLSKHENIIQVAVGAGLDKVRVTTLLDSTEGLDEVTRAEQTNYEREISGVPFYIINNKYGVSGAQPTEFFKSTFLDLVKKI